MSGGSRASNRLARESSPYLLQHAHNPVPWYPWSDEALARAKAEDKPIFLSIGYAACHWCHVMERESFEDPAIAALLADGFVAVKVDREERPDLDAVYMSAVQAMTGSGGWPLSVFLTPDLEPFFGGTYFPPERRYGMPSFRDVLTGVAEAWSRRRVEVAGTAARLAAHLAHVEAPGGGDVDVSAASARAVRALEAEHDPRWGGFGAAPKFPTPSRLFFLVARARSDDRALRMLACTLDAMAAGGMHDWLGGGFHRYSVDERWLVPHFEKMLYDNALLARAYGEAGIALGRDDWLRVARATAEYLVREMRGPEGGFFSSTDADSEGREGIYFTWTEAEVRSALPSGAAEIIVRLCDLRAPANFEGGRTVLRPARPLAEVAAELGVAPGEAAAALAEARRGLLEARGRRSAPPTDDKRLAAWNGMAVWSLAFLGAALTEPAYLEAARAAARFLLGTTGSDGRLARSWRGGRTSGVETLEDVGWVAAGLVQLYEADGRPEWLASARALLARRLPRYQDPSGLLFEAPDDGPSLLLRPRSPYDGATPSAAAVAARSALRIAALTGDDALRAAAGRAIRADAGALARAPEASLELLEAARAAARPPAALVVAGEPGRDSTAALLAAAWCHRPAWCAIAPSPAAPVPAAAADAAPILVGREPGAGGRARAYLCEGGACRLPVEDPDELARVLDALDR